MGPVINIWEGRQARLINLHVSVKDQNCNTHSTWTERITSGKPEVAPMASPTLCRTTKRLWSPSRKAAQGPRTPAGMPRRAATRNKGWRGKSWNALMTSDARVERHRGGPIALGHCPYDALGSGSDGGPAGRGFYVQGPDTGNIGLVPALFLSGAGRKVSHLQSTGILFQIACDAISCSQPTYWGAQSTLA